MSIGETTQTKKIFSPLPEQTKRISYTFQNFTAAKGTIFRETTVVKQGENRGTLHTGKIL